MPRLTLISINLNGLQGLRKTMDSIFTQTFTDYEYIIIDGGSTDGSLEEIKKNQDKLVYWTSEKDEGIYNAMNKGIVKAKGEYILFMNSGDYLYSEDTLHKVFENANNEDLIYGDAMVDTGKGDSNPVYHYPEKLTFKHFVTRTLHHTSCLIRSELFKKYGLYNEENKIMSDWEFFIKAICLYQVSYKYLPIIISCFNENGVSSQVEYIPLKLHERRTIMNKYFKAFISDFQLMEERLQRAEARLRLYQNSRLHNAIEKLIHLKIYKYLKSLTDR